MKAGGLGARPALMTHRRSVGFGAPSPSSLIAAPASAEEAPDQTPYGAAGGGPGATLTPRRRGADPRDRVPAPVPACLRRPPQDEPRPPRHEQRHCPERRAGRQRALRHGRGRLGPRLVAHGEAQEQRGAPEPARDSRLGGVSGGTVCVDLFIPCAVHTPVLCTP